MLKVQFFKNEKGKSPFKEWLNTLSTNTKDRVISKLFRIQNGNLGDYKRVGTGVFEFRLFFCGGLRIYFGKDGEEIILLLCGGDKNSQKRDIEKALEYWSQYLEQKED